MVFREVTSSKESKVRYSGNRKNGKDASRGEVTGEMIKGGDDLGWTVFGGCAIWTLKWCRA